MLYSENFHDATPLIQQGFEYWQSRAGTRAAPKWSDIDPMAMPKLLPNVVVIHVLRDPIDFVERITGQVILEHSARNSMHIHWRDYHGRGPNSQIWQALVEVMENITPSFRSLPYVGPHKDFVSIQNLLCPISDDGKGVNKLLGFVDYLRGDKKSA